MPSLARILLVDDSEPDLIYTRIVLERAGVAERIDAFESAREALAWLASGDQGVDLILLDINMPGMNGFEFLEACRGGLQGGGRLPAVVMLSSSPDPADLRRVQAFPNVRGFVTKPLGTADAARLPQLARA
jgi:CheY-like chemotaxis protein